MATSSYALRPLHRSFGAEVQGLPLRELLAHPEAIHRIKEDLLRHRMLVFKNQDVLSGTEHVLLSELLGELECSFEKHPRSPDPRIFRVSNDRAEGFTRIGRSGWHIDGTSLLKPFAYQTMHFHAVVQGGDTLFLPLKEFLDAQETSLRKRWEQLWMVTGYGPVHPLVCRHPERDEDTMCFHCGRNYCTGWILGDPDSLEAQLLPAKSVREELTRAIWNRTELIHRQEWELGDFAIIDNRALAHFADSGTQVHPSKGLRILHRTTVAGEKQCESRAFGRSSFSCKASRVSSAVPGPRALGGGAPA